MPDIRTLAAAYGVRIEIAPLGDWGSATLVAEYDPDGPVIRINEAALPHGSSCDVRDAIDRAIAHELYHHREAIGEIPRAPNRAAREAAADSYAELATAVPDRAPQHPPHTTTSLRGRAGGPHADGVGGAQPGAERR